MGFKPNTVDLREGPTPGRRDTLDPLSENRRHGPANVEERGIPDVVVG